MSRLLPFLIMPLFFMATGCAKLGLQAASGGGVNDPVPTGAAVVAQGNFSSYTSVAISGSVTIYNSSGTYILRLAGLSVTGASSGSLEIIPVNGQGEQAALPLRADTGNQNYTLANATGSIYSQVKIRATGGTSDLAIAGLTQVPTLTGD